MIRPNEQSEDSERRLKPEMLLTLEIPTPIDHVELDYEVAVPAASGVTDAQTRGARPPVLAPHHLQEMQASGIPDELITKSGIRTVTGPEACQMLGWTKKLEAAGPGWAIPFDDPASPDCYWRVKFDQPRLQEGREIKYESPVGSSNRAYFPPGFDSSDGVTIYITEGEKKSLSAIAHGINCLGLTGVWNWQEARPRDDAGRGYGPRHLIDDLAGIHWAKREVVICFDSDAAEKHLVELALQKLAEMLAKWGAEVKVARLPNGPNGEKLGLDDAIVQLGIEAVRNVLEAATEPELPKLSYLDLARMFIEAEFSINGEPTLRYWRSEFWRWTGRHYESVDEDSLKNAVYRLLDRVGWQTTRSLVAEVLAALKAEVEVDHRLEPPCWLGPQDEIGSATPLAFNNCVLLENFTDDPGVPFINTWQLLPQWFVTGSRDFNFDPAAQCPTWEAFLQSSLPDPDARLLLQQWFGYVISCRLHHHRLLILHGEPRSGKSLIASTMAQMVGNSATGTSTLGSLQSRFGLWALLGKQLLIIPEAQDRGQCISSVEKLKSITGCDGLDIDRKNLPILTNVQLQTRVVIVCNMLPRFSDPSGALYGRVLLAHFPISFQGREDRTLASRIQKELPGIFNWARAGWQSLRTMGRFVVPSSSKQILDDAEKTFSPIAGFLEEACEVDPAHKALVDDVWDAWRQWCRDANYQPANKGNLTRLLRAAVTGLERRQLRYNMKRPYFYLGLKLNDRGVELAATWRSADRKASLGLGGI